MSKYRHHKIKRQHHVLAALEEGLTVMANLPMVQSIIPGTIKPKSGGTTGFTFQYTTATGLKFIGRSSGAAQEVFLVTSHPSDVLAALQAHGVIPKAAHDPQD